MSKKDYELIASAIRSVSAMDNVWAVAKAIADKIMEREPRFDRARFMHACGF